MKKILSILFATLLTFACFLALVSCQGKNETTNITTEEQTTTTNGEMPVGDNTQIRVGALKGPTTIGLVNLMEDCETKVNTSNYVFTMETQATALSALLNQGSLDIALIPANLASVLYNKLNTTETSGIAIIDINTLGVLYCVTGDESIKSMTDLKNKTIVTTGQGTTPEFAIRYLINKCGLNETEYSLDFRSEATEVASVLKADPNAIAVLPQPFVTVATTQNTNVKVAFSLHEEWNKYSSDSSLVTGVTVVRKEFLSTHPDLVKKFLTDHAKSANEANTNVEKTATLVVKQGIIANEAIAKKAIPFCNVTCITGNEMKTLVSGYLKTLYDLNPSSIGGKLIGDDGFYIE